MRNHLAVVSPAILMATALVTPALACTMSPPQPPPTFWIGPLSDNGDGTSSVTIGQKISLFPPTIITQCACGLGIGGPSNPVPFGLELAGVRIVVVGPNDEIVETLSEFAPLTLNPNTSAGLGSGPGSQPGATWFGFTGLINPFPPPVLQPDFMFKLLFDVRIPNSSLPQWFSGVPAQVAGGTADGQGFPDFGGEHPMQYFQPVDNTVPTPGATSLGLLAAAVLLRRRR